MKRKSLSVQTFERFAEVLGESGRRGPTVSEWQKELKQLDHPSLRNASTRRKSTLEPHETTKHYSPNTMKGVAPLSCTPHDGKWTWVFHFPARQQFMVSEIDEYARGSGWKRGHGQALHGHKTPMLHNERVYIIPR